MSPEILDLINKNNLKSFDINELEKNNIFSFELILLQLILFKNNIIND